MGVDPGRDLHSETLSARLLVEAMRQHGWDEGDIGLAVESETDFPEAVSAAVRRCAELEKLARAAKDLASDYEQRARDLMARRETMRETVVTALERAGVSLPLRLPEGTVTLANQAPGAVVTDEASIPEEYWREKIAKSIDLRAVAADLRDRKVVPGAVLLNSRRTLQVRTK